MTFEDGSNPATEKAGEELAKSCPSTYLSAMSSGTAFGLAVQAFGSQAQKDGRKNPIAHLRRLLRSPWAAARICSGTDHPCDTSSLAASGPPAART